MTNPQPLTGAAEWIIDQLLPSREVHLIGGPSGAGKTTYLFQLIEDWSQGKPIFGFQSYPVPFLYVSYDRSAESVNRTMARCGVSFPSLSIIDHKELSDKSLFDILNTIRIQRKFSNTRLFIIDGFTGMCPGGKINEYSVVASWLGQLARYCKLHNVTILGAVHATKTKEGESILNPRQRIIGSTAWAGFSDTVITIDPEKPEDGNSIRKLEFMPRNAGSISRKMIFNDSGRLVEFQAEKEAQAENASRFLLEEFIGKLPAGQDTPVKVFQGFAEEHDIPARTLYRWLDLMVEQGLLEKIRRGFYAKRHFS